MARNQLPEGVGKKIVEALKRQAEADISPMEEENLSVSNNLPLTEIEDNLPEIKYETAGDDIIIEEEPDINPETVKLKSEQNDDDLLDEPLLKIKEEVLPEKEPVSEPPQYYNNVQTGNEKINDDLNNLLLEKSNSSENSTLPANVEKLRKLISGLPSGVTKQTGAQIIKQTFDAMGIPMNNVLKEAQSFVEELNSSTREYMIKIQEYKTQILQLEQSVQEYQKNVSQVNDLVSLFLSADK